MPTFQHDNMPSTVSLTGTYDFTNATIKLPSGDNVGASTAGGQIQFIPASGKLLIGSGTAFAQFQGAEWAEAVAPSMSPDDVSISGVLMTWVNESGLAPDVPGQSGLDEWIDNMTGETFTAFDDDALLASGTQNGLDAGYFIDAGVSQGRFHGTDSSAMDPFNGADKPITIIAAFMPDGQNVGDAHWSNVFGYGDINDAFENTWFFGVDADAKLGWAKHQDGGASKYNRNPGPVFGEWMVGCVADSGITCRLYKNAVEITDAPSGTDITTVGFNRIGLGCQPNNQSNVHSMNGFIGEIAVYASGLTTEQVEQVSQGLMTKWGIS